MTNLKRSFFKTHLFHLVSPSHWPLFTCIILLCCIIIINYHAVFSVNILEYTNITLNLYIFIIFTILLINIFNCIRLIMDFLYFSLWSVSTIFNDFTKILIDIFHLLKFILLQIESNILYNSWKFSNKVVFIIILWTLMLSYTNSLYFYVESLEMSEQFFFLFFFVFIVYLYFI